jgi:Uma2 family endonuclease
MHTMTEAPTIQTRVGMPLDEFIREHERQPFELIGGERKLIMPTVAGHNYIIKLLITLLVAYEQAFQRTEALFEATYILPDSYSSDWVKGSHTPDAMIYKLERLTAYRNNTPDWRTMPYALIPDVVIEVVSPNDSYNDIEKKIQEYQQDGVLLIWIINPDTYTIAQHTPNSKHVTRFTLEDTLTGGDVLPDLSIELKALFA